ncbi:hypothetical protein CWB84_00425 [Staphylococcus haemolyticus]|uniref:hypothetical protein n=1 Tax=Staphylococcus haemolyticus TaxID=1283 RepID=UPI000C26A0F5|nr:hypothetical protein [Staphylococcus haemolyticus]PJM59752.1 hypothetical protein CWB84_00425 [Staphylococcus haemolyticus]
MGRNIITSLWDRDNLIKINDNFVQLFDDYLIASDLKSFANDILKKANNINQKNVDVQKQLNDIITNTGDTNAEVIQARGTYKLLSERLNNIEESTGIDPVNYGLSENASWQTNRDAIQKAIDEAYSIGGGEIVLKPGVYTVKGLVLKSHVTLAGKGVTLKHPDGIAPDIIRTEIYNTTGSVLDDKKTIALNDLSKVEKGSVLAIRAARGAHTSQNTQIINGISDKQTTGIVLKNAEGLVNSGVMIIGGEIISYTGVQNNELQGVVRGIYGTTPSSYSSDTSIALATRFYTTVDSVKNNKVTVVDTIPLMLSDVDISIGTTNPVIKDVQIDGNRIIGGAPSEVHPIKCELTRFGLIDNVTIRNGESGIMARNGNHDLLINNPTFIDCSIPENTLGSGGWMFRGNRRCKYLNVTAVGKMWTGVYFDDRTSHSTEWDEENYDCILDGLYAKLDRLTENLGFAMVGGVRNLARNCKISGPRTGFSCTSNSQGTGYPSYNARDNQFESIQVDNVYQPTIIKAQRTKLINVTYDEDTTAYRKFTDYMTDTQYINCGGYNPKTLYEDGTYNSPSYAFTNDSTTGFYRITNGQIQFVSKGVATVRMIENGMMLAEGKDLSFGAGTGSRIGTSSVQKLGFYGATPIKQPSKIGTIVTSASQEDIVNQLNSVIVALRNLGLVSNV